MYRGSTSSGPVCTKHASAPAASACWSCQEPICEPCIVYFGAQPHCHPCAVRRRRNRAIGRAALGVGAIALVGGLVAAAALLKPRFDYGEHRMEVERLQHAVEKDRCDKTNTLAYDEKLLEVGDTEGVLLDTSAFFKACGDWYRLHWTAYTAHERRREHQAAADEASKLIAHNPGDKDYWWWRAQAEEELGQLDQAAADYRQTLVNLPRIQNIPFNLADVYEKLGQPCRALGAVEQFLFHYPDKREDAQVAARVKRLASTGNCARLAGHGTAIVQAWGTPSHGRVGAGMERGRFAIDRTAAYVIVTRAFAERVHAPVKGAPIQVVVDGQRKAAQLVTLPELAIDQAHAAEVEAAVVDALPDRLDGVVGLSFLTRFETNLDGPASDEDDEDADVRDGTGELHLVAAP